MTFIQSFILGIIQGITEFLPISSSAHLVLVPYLLGWQIPEEQIFPYNVLIQVGTLIAVVLYFWSDLLSLAKAFLFQFKSNHPGDEKEIRMAWHIIIATIPAGIIGLLINDLIKDAFQSPLMTAIFLLITAALLLFSEKIGKRNRPIESMNWMDALWIGFAQSLAVFPGISRSGSTIAGGLSRNFNRPEAARFSFLMSVPIMFAAGLLSIFDLLEVPNLGEFLPVLLVGFITSAVVGYFSIHWLLKFLTQRSLKAFAFYCILVSIIVQIIIYAS